MKKIPYGISSYEKLKKENYYFVDKTPSIEKLEDLGSQYLFFLRPRRFGKSLFISMLESYYDIDKKNEFDILFGDTYIGKNSTPLKNSFLILNLNFSVIQTYGSVEQINRSFYISIRGAISNFIYKYREITGDCSSLENQIEKIDNAGDVFNMFIMEMDKKRIRLYLLIDEYDNFANNILIEHGQDTYQKITHSGGFVRGFFSVIKGGTANKTIDRLFVTGVSPMLLSDVTSGFNIGDIISNDLFAAAMIGFTGQETETLVEYYIENGVIAHDLKEKIRLTMKENYNNYCFGKNTDLRLYNSDMVLYFINKYIKNEEFPDKLIDENVRTDYGKLRYLILTGKKLNGNFNILTEILNNGTTTGELIESFSVNETVEETKFRSLLYYLGFITIKKQMITSMYEFVVPNLVTAAILWDYIRKALAENYPLKINSDRLDKGFAAMALAGEWRSVITYMTEKFYEACSNRDFVYHELGIKMFFLAYFNMTPYYLVHSEPETAGGFADIWLQRNYHVTELTKHEFLIELKYLKSGNNDVETAYSEALSQLTRYANDKKIPAKTRKIIIVLNAQEILRMEEV